MNIKLKDYRNSFKETHIAKPYYLYVEWGNKNFYFSNRFKAERFLTKFKKHSLELYKEVNEMLFNVFLLSAKICELSPFADTRKHQKTLLFYYERYQLLLTGYGGNVEIGTELNNVYCELISQLGFYKKHLRKNTRHKYLYFHISTEIKKAKRLKKDFDLLLSGADGIKQITNSEVKQYNFEKVLKVA